MNSMLAHCTRSSVNSTSRACLLAHANVSRKSRRWLHAATNPATYAEQQDWQSGIIRYTHCLQVWGIRLIRASAPTPRDTRGTMTKAKDDANVLQSLAGAGLASYIRFVYRTSRMRKDPPDLYERLQNLHPVILAMWHGQFLLVPKLDPGGVRIRVMVARHGDAEILSQALSRFDVGLIRGAGAGGRQRDRGGRQALRAAIRSLDEGCSVAMTADVPPGPARRAGMGIVTLARLSGVHILPAAMATSRYHAFDTWSRFTVNLPFSTMGVAIGDAISVPRDASPEELEVYRQQVEDGLNAATARAYQLAGADPTRAQPHWQKSIDKNHGAHAASIRLRAYRAGTRALKPLAPLILKARERRGKEDPARRQERLGIAHIPRPDGPLVWLHAASVGETNAILPVIAGLEAARPSVTCLLTTGTTTSAELAASRLSERAIHQFVPLDAPQFVHRFLDHWQPELAVFTESEIWPNLITHSADRNVPLVLVNARMSQRSFRKWRRSIKLARELFGRFNLVLAQNEKLARRFQELGVGNSRGVGNLKIDAPPPPVDEFELQRLRRALNGRPVVLGASTHPGEDELLADAHEILKSRVPNCLTIVAPRHPERGDAIAAMFAEQGLRVAQRSLDELPDQGSDIYVADTIGELGMLFALAPVAFIGGSLVPLGGQNPIEAVRHDAAVLTGPHRLNFTDEYRPLLNSGGAQDVQSAAELADAMARLINDEAARARMLQNARDALAKLSGALPVTIEALLFYLPEGEDEGLKRAS